MMEKQLALVRRSTIYEIVHGSHAYGTSGPTSDLDIRGICVVPDRRLFFGSQVFEQQDKGWDGDTIIFHLPKFMTLAGECNPNIIEMLWVAPENVRLTTPAGEKLRARRDIFLSKKCRHTFAGYAKSQLQRIRAHKRWLDKPPEKPDRDAWKHKKTVPIGPMGTQLSENTRIVAIRPQSDAGWFELDCETFDRSGYDAAKTEWDHYRSWRENRNEKRAALEAKHSFDTKHASHLVRLLRMGLEILTRGEIVVKRPDAQELLAIRNGAWSYDRILEYTDEMDVKLDEAHRASTLPEEANWKAIEELQVELIEEALSKPVDASLLPDRWA